MKTERAWFGWWVGGGLGDAALASAQPVQTVSMGTNPVAVAVNSASGGLKPGSLAVKAATGRV